MKPSRYSVGSLFAVFAWLLLPWVARAHPGHDHGDIPSMIRHPFAGMDHLLISAAVFLVVGLALVATAHAFASARSVRWIGAGLMAAGVALALV